MTWEVRLRTAELAGEPPTDVGQHAIFRDDLLRQRHKEQVLEFLCCLPSTHLVQRITAAYQALCCGPPTIECSAGELRPPLVDKKRPDATEASGVWCCGAACASVPVRQVPTSGCGFNAPPGAPGFVQAVTQAGAALEGSS
jgi:hypothetical protein